MTAAIDITAGQRKALLVLLRRYIPGVAVWAYGSRVKWTARLNSDLDLVAFTTPEQQPLVSELKEALAESDLPFLVDFHVWDDVPERFHEIIRKEYVVLQEARHPIEVSGMVSDSKAAARAHLADAGVDELPDDWDVIELGDLLSEERGISVGVMYPGEHDPDGVPLIKAGDMNGSIINPHPEFRISREKHNEYRRTALEGGELLMTLVGNVGQCAVVPPRMAGWNTARAVAVMRLKDQSDVHFVQQCLLSRPLQHLMDVWCNTTVQATLNLKEIRQLPLPWPPKPSRDAIAAIGKALDDKIELNRRMNATLEAMARALFQSWFVDFDPVRAKLDGRQPAGLDAATAALFPAHFQESPLGHIPQGWTIEPVGEVVECVGGGTPSTAEPKFWVGGTHHWTTPKDFSSLQAPILLDTDRKITDAGVAKISSGLLPAGTLLLSSRAPVGYLAIAAMPVAINQGFIAIKCNERASNFFMLNWCQENMAEIESRATGTTFAEISKTNFRPILVVLPPKELMAAFTEKVAPLYAEITTNLQQSSTLATICDALLPKLLSGELRVSEADSSNEVYA